MSFIPFENFYIISKLTPAEVQTKLEKVVSPTDNSFRGLFSNKIDTPFSGYVSPNKSLFKPNINYRNSFIPEIKLETEPYLNGSRIHIKMKLLDAVFVFMCIWMGFAVIFGIVSTVSTLNAGESPAFTLAPLGMLAFGYLLTTGGFKMESTGAKSTLLKLLGGEIAMPKK